MTRYTFTLNSRMDRERAAATIAAAPTGTRVEVKAQRRTPAQNDKLWAMLTDVANQVMWHGRRLRPDDWKFVFLDALKRETRTVPGIDGTSMVDLGRSSSDLTKEEMGNLFEIIQFFGALHGVKFSDEQVAA